MKRTFYLYEDPGHAWLKVPGETLTMLGMVPGDFSSFSYQRAGDVYLEEDSDMPHFLKVFEEKTGKVPRVSVACRADKSSRIRTYTRIVAGVGCASRRLSA